MVWMTNDQQLARMVAACRVQWGEPDLWWRDEGELSEVWESKGWPTGARAGCAMLPCGAGRGGEGIAVWIYRSGEALLAVEGFGVSDGIEWRGWNDRPADLVTLFNARDKGGPPKRGAIEAGQYVGWMDGRKVCVGRAVTVTPEGNAALVELCGGGVVAAGDLGAKRVWPVAGRAEALDWFWQRGEATFNGYGAFKSKLWHKQQAVTGTKLEKVPRPSRVPDNTPRGIPLAVGVARLAAEKDRAAAEIERLTAILIALPETDLPAMDKAHAALVKAEAISAAAWDAWDKARLAELLE